MMIFYPRASRLLDQEHHTASVKLKKYLEGLFEVKFRNHSTTALEVLEDLQLFSYEEIGGL